MNSIDYRGKCPPHLFLEGYSVDSLESGLKNAIADHLEKCQLCQEQLKSIKAERKEFLRFHAIPRVQEFTPIGHLSPFWRFIALRVAPVCALLLISLFFLVPIKQQDHYVAFKGSFNFQLYVTRNNHTFLGGDGVYLPGDKLQFSILSDSPTFVYILNCDATGRITSYYPDPGSVQMPIQSNNQFFLPISITLDDYLGLERIFVFTSQNEQDVLSLLKRVSQTIEDRPLESVTNIEGIEGLQKTYLIIKTG